MSKNDKFGWIDQVINEHKVQIVNKNRNENDTYVETNNNDEKDMLINELFEENRLLKIKLEQCINGVYREELKMRIGELEDEKRELFINFKEIDLLKKKENKLLMNKIENMKDVVNDGIENLRKVIEEKEHLAQFLLVINGFFGRVNHYLQNYSDGNDDDRDDNDLKILERKCNIIEGILKEGYTFNVNNIMKSLHTNPTSHIGEFQTNAMRIKQQSHSVSQNNSINIANRSNNSFKRRKQAQDNHHK